MYEQRFNFIFRLLNRIPVVCEPAEVARAVCFVPAAVFISPAMLSAVVQSDSPAFAPG